MKLRPIHGIGWNLAIGGDRPAIGRIVSIETREKLRKGRLGYVNSAETRAKISKNAMGNTRARGTKRTAEQKEKIRLSRLGSKASDAARANMSACKIGKKRSPEYCEKLRIRSTGKIYGAETRLKMSISAKARRAREKANPVLRLTDSHFKVSIIG